MNKLELEIQRTAVRLTAMGLELTGDSQWDWQGQEGSSFTVTFTREPWPQFRCVYCRAGQLDVVYFDLDETDFVEARLSNVICWAMYYMEGGTMTKKGTIGYGQSDAAQAA